MMKYCFADFEIDLDTQELRQAGAVVRVEPQVFDLLVYLVENREKLVDHDELIETIWRGRIVSDSAIAARISAARKAVGDDGKNQRIIKTLPRKGFMFLPAVETVSGRAARNDSKSAQLDSRPALQTRRRQTTRFCESADGTRIALATTGSGIPLVRTGHWMTHIEHDWHSPIWRPFLDELGQRFEIVRYDQRGNGLSDWEVEDFSLERFTEDLEAVVDSTGRDRFALYAASQGVPVAVNYVARHPERVSHLILQGGFARGRLVRKSDAEVKQGEAILTLMQHGWGLAGTPFLKSFTAMYIPDGTREQMDSLVELQRITTNARNAISIRRAIDLFDVTELLPKVATKTLVVHARDDGVQPLDQGRALAAGIPNSEFVLLESANHVVLPEEPAWQRFFLELDRFVQV